MKKQYFSPVVEDVNLLATDLMIVSSPGDTPPEPAPRRSSPSELLD